MVQAGAPSPTQVGGESVTSGGHCLCLVAPCSLIGQNWPGQACLPTYLLPRVLPALDLSPGALLYPVSDKPGLELSEGRKDRKEELGSLLGEG